MMGEKVTVPIPPDSRLARQIWRCYGLGLALEAMGKADSTEGRYPGAALARARVEKVMAEERAILSQQSLKTVAKAGHDIAKAKLVETEFSDDGAARLAVTFYDMAELAEAE